MKTPLNTANPLALITGKFPQDFTRADLMKIIREKQPQRLTFHYTALDGKLKELKIPVIDPRQIEQILSEGERVDGSSLFKGIVDAGVSDLFVVPVYRSVFLNPFDSGSLDFICRFLTHEGELAPFAPDTILHRAAGMFRRRSSYELHTMGELEFFLLSNTDINGYRLPRQRGYHTSEPFTKSGALLSEILYHVSQVTGRVKYAHSEVGMIESVRSDLPEIMGKRAEQMEIEFLPAPVEEAADDLVLARWLIRNIANRHGCVATFTPKLEEGIAGNGLHIHMALYKDNQNQMTAPDGSLSNDARRLIGGLCHYADSLTAFGNTTSSAYLRLVPNQEAPTHICWSDRNRSSMIRVPLAWGTVNNLAQRVNPAESESFDVSDTRQTVELRSPDGSAHVHLLLAGITLAADWGLSDPLSTEIAEKLYVSGNIFREPELLHRLPVLAQSCVGSSRILLEKRSYYERGGVFPPAVTEYLARLLLAENDEHMNQNLADLPADDRLIETRKIMHKDLHRH